MTYDGKYLYISKAGGFLHYSHYYSPQDPVIYVADTAGNYYGSVTYHFGDYKGACALNFVNGRAYIQTEEKILSCPVDDLLGGNEDWREAYTFEDVEYKIRY